MEATTALAGCLSTNAAAVSTSVRGGSFRVRPAASGGPGSGRCNHAVAVRAEKNADTGSSRSRRELLAGTLAGTILLPGGAALGGVESGPLPAPDLSKCTTAYMTADKSYPTECCPPGYTAPPDIIDFRPDPKIPFRIRPPLHTIDAEYVRKFNLAYERMRALPDDDPRSWYQQAKVHCSYCNGAYPLAKGQPGAVEQIHFTWFFYPFHRAELYFHERILASLIDDPTFALPFWNWDNQSLTAGANRVPAYFNDPAYAGLYDKNRNALHMPGGPNPIVDLGYFGKSEYTSEDVVRANNLAVMYNAVATTLTARNFLGGKSFADGTNGDGTTVGQAGSVEGAPHTSVHIWGGDKANSPVINADLGNFATAAFDPLFFQLHGNVDRLWKVWEGLPSDQTTTGRTVRKVKLADGRIRGDDYRKNYTDKEFLDASFLFYNEKKQLVRIKVSDTLDQRGSMRYDYPDLRSDLAWLNYGTVLSAANGLGDATKSAELLQEYAKDPRSVIEQLQKSAKPAAAGFKADDFPEFGSTRTRGNKEQDLGDQPVTLRVIPEAITPELRGLDFEDLEKTLVLQGVLVPKEGNLAFSVYINFPSANEKTSKAIPQYVGSYQSIPEGKQGGDVGKYRRVDVRFDISANIELLGIKKLSKLLVTIVPQGDDTEKGVKLKGALLDLD